MVRLYNVLPIAQLFRTCLEEALDSGLFLNSLASLDHSQQYHNDCDNKQEVDEASGIITNNPD